jgi:hypothetical protein
MSTRSSSQLSVFEPLTDATDDPEEKLNFIEKIATPP